jgi:hypothetical protein
MGTKVKHIFKSCLLNGIMTYKFLGVEFEVWLVSCQYL